jgi:hypothetical protein
MRHASTVVALLISVSCSSETLPLDPTDDAPPIPEVELPGTVLVKDPASLAQFVIGGGNRAIPLIRDSAPPAAAGAVANAAMLAREDEVKLMLDVEVKPPEVGESSLQATHIAVNGKWVYVTYAQIGEGPAGAIDVLNVTGNNELKMISRVTFENTEYYGVTVANDRLYLVGASADPKLEERAVLDVISLRSGQMNERVAVRRIALTSYAGTSVHVQNGFVWATSGSGGRNVGGLTILREKDLEVMSRERFEDARAVHGAGAYVVVFSGMPGRARVFDSKSAKQLGRTLDVGGAEIAESKGTAWVEGDWAFLGAGNGGVKVISLTREGGVLAGKGIPIPELDGVPPELSTTNAVATAGDGIVISASGETGVHIYASNHLKYKPGSADAEPEIVRLGRLDFGTRISANFVAGDRKRIFVASGLGGLKIVRIE